MKRVVLVLVGLVGVVLAPAARAEGKPWHAWSVPTGGAFREAALVNGELVYTNGINQAAGANSDRIDRDQYFGAVRPASEDGYQILTDDLFGVHRLAHNGDYELPADVHAYPDGTAEISELRLAVDGDDLFVRWRFTSMPRPDAAIATLAFLSEHSDATAVDWPRGANVRSRWDVALTAWGTGGVLEDRHGHSTKVTVRTGNHVIEARVPLSSLPPGPWTLSGGAGLDDPNNVGSY